MSEEIGSGEAGNPGEGAAPAEGQAPKTPETGDFLSTIENADTKSWAESKGITSLDQALTSYHNLEKVFGADKAGRTVTMLGDEPTPEESAVFYNKLGRPEEAAGYAFAAPEGADPAFAEAAKSMFHEIGISDTQASAVVDWYNGQAGGAVEKTETEYNEQIATDTAALKTEWGAAYDKNILAAKAAAREFGLDETQVTAMEKALGFAGLMRFTQNIGAKLGEDTHIGGEGNTDGGLMTPEAAKTAMQELSLSKEWNEAWMGGRSHPGHAAAVAKKERLSKLMVGVAP